MATQLELPVADAIRDLSDYDSREEERPYAPAVNPQLPDRSAAQPSSRAFRNIAAARLRAAAVHREERARLTPEQVADRRTSLMDARIALCVATGNSLDDIDPSSGNSMSPNSYEATRHSWISLIKFHGFNNEYDQPPLDEALAWWTERCPQYLNEDDWLAAGMVAHVEYWQGVGHGCGAPYCEMHGESSEGK